MPDPDSRPPSGGLPRGIVLFGPRASRRYRRRRLGVAAVLLAAFLAVLWPVYPLASAAFPLVLGLPLSLAWVVGWLVVVFATLTWLYRSERQEPGGGSR